MFRKLLTKFFSKLETKDFLYIHGFSSKKEDHEELKVFLEKAGYNFHWFDLPGHGENKPDGNINTTFFECRAAIIEFIEKKNLNNFVIMGHSMGGGLVMSVYPEIKDRVKLVILECPHSRAVTGRQPTELLEGLKYIVEDKNEEDQPKKGLIKILREYYASKNEYNSLLKNILSSETLDSIENGARQIAVQTLLILSEKDYVIPPLATKKYLGSLIPNIQIDTIANAFHSPLKDEPELLKNSIASFLKIFNKK